MNHQPLQTTRTFKTPFLFSSLCSLCTLWLSILFLSPTTRADAPARNLADAAAATPDLEPASRDMAAAARKFLDSLTPEQRAKATFEFNSDQREDWYFVPRVRKGLTLKD